MTHNPNQDKTYLPCSSNRKIVVGDGTTTTVAGIVDVQVTSNLVLKMFFMPLNYPLILFQYKNFPKIYVVVLYLMPPFVNFRTRVWGGRLDLPRSTMDSTS